ncbi:MAG: CHAT domain-containing protein [Chitinophagaceae bacterium]|nr:CHAT domain-containing protein [Chitinophagaceae bacterium]
MANRQLLIILVCFFLRLHSSAQINKPNQSEEAIFLSYFKNAEKALEKDTAKAAITIQGLDSACKKYEAAYPLYIANIKLWQSWYQFSSKKLPHEFRNKGNEYLAYAIQKIKAHEKEFIDSFSLDILNLGLSFNDINSLEIFKPIDSLIRKGCGKKYATKTNDYSITLYAWNLFNANKVTIAANLAAYEKTFFKKVTANSDVDDRIGYLFNNAIILNNKFTKWREDNDAFDVNYLQNEFSIWVKATNSWLYNDYIKNNVVDSKSYNYGNRLAYILLYQNLIIPFAELSFSNNNMGLAAVQLNKYIKNVLFPQTDYSKAIGNTDFSTYNYLSTCTNLLSEMYYSIGEYQRGIYCLYAVKKKFCSTDGKWIDSLVGKNSIQMTYYFGNAKHNAALGKIELSDAYIDILKLYYPKPVNRDSTTKNAWDGYIYTRTLEIDCLQKTGRSFAAQDSLLKYYGIIYNNDSLPYPGKNHESYWQYIVGNTLVNAKVWDLAYNTLRYSIVSNKKNYFYDKLFYYDLIANYIQAEVKLSNRIINWQYLNNLVAYTEKQIKKNLISLSPDQRIIFYENKLLPIFNLYHSLIAEGYLDNDTITKDAIISQSVSLKNYLLSNNEILKAILAQTQKPDVVKTILAIKKRIVLFEGEAMLLDKTGMYNEFDELKDDIEEVFRSLLNRKTTDSLATFVTAKKVASKLTEKDVYLEFIRFNNVFKGDTLMYAAVSVNNKSKNFSFTNLFTEQHLIQLFKNRSSSPQLAAIYNSNQRSVSIKKKPADSTTTEISSSVIKDKLGNFIFDSLQAILKDKKRIIFIPDGYLNRISFAALQLHDKFLFERYQLKQLSANRMLFKTNNSSFNNFFLAGGINYDRTNCNSENKFLSKDISWNYLPGSLKEISALYNRFNNKIPTTLVKEDNLVDSVNLSNYAYIHLATHGFYFDSSEVKNYFADGIYVLDNIKKLPLLRSGIVLSNANCPPKGNTRENRYLLGYELAAQNLSNCKLITLSACESALGDIKSNLGVMGLQRAIKLAGAQKMLITLWKIPDNETVEFMQLFYDFLLGKRLTEEESLKKTQELMSKKYAVSKWGAFVLIE